MDNPWLEVYHFTFKGIEGRIEKSGQSVFVCYGNCGAHLDSLAKPLRDFVMAVMKREPDRRCMK